MSLDCAFSLWADYVEVNLKTADGLAPRLVHTLSYEELLEKPMEVLPAVAQFAGLQADEAKLTSVVRDVRRDRGCAFTNDPELVEFYRRCVDHPLMLRLGYGNLVPGAPE